MFYTIKSIWSIYTGTAVGQHFLASGSVTAEVMQSLAEVDPLSTSLELTWLYLLYCFVIAATAQVFYLRHFLFTSKPLTIKFAWIFGTTYFLTEATQNILGLDHWGGALFVSIPSATILLVGCMKVAEQIIPDAGMILSFVVNKFRNII